MVEATGQVLQAACDVGAAGQAKQTDRDVSGGGHELWRGAGSDLGTVFVVIPNSG